jgi:hypothetical protein
MQGRQETGLRSLFFVDFITRLPNPESNALVAVCGASAFPFSSL